MEAKARGAASSEMADDEMEPELAKNDVMRRCEGSLAAPANWRFVRGADIVMDGQ